jgi:nucleoside 2-deoxyribosyltransferase
MASLILGVCRDVLIYLAGPLFSEAERRFNLEIAHRLEVFLPQRDSVERDRPPYDTMVAEERRHAMFHLDRSRILDADVFLFMLDGRVPDEGACVELGIAYCQKYPLNGEKLLVGLHTDTDDEVTLLRLLAGQGSGVEAGTE